MRWIAAVTMGCAAIVARPVAAVAQSFEADRYTLPMLPGDLFETERANTAPHLSPNIAASLEYAHDSLVVHDASGAMGPNVENDLRAHVAITLGLFGRLQLGVALPLVLYARDVTPQLSSASGSTGTPSGFGDLRADLRVRLLGPNYGAGFRLAAAASLIFPTGDPALYASDDTVEPVGRLLGEYETRGGYRVVLNVGVQYRPHIVLPYLTIDSEAFARFGVAVPLESTRAVYATLEAAGSVMLSDHAFAHGGWSFEGLAGIKYVTQSGTYFGLAFGPGVDPGLGTPSLRALVTVGRGYADPTPSALAPGDDDHDGVVNSHDACPNVAMGARPDPTRPGCPAIDADRDGYIDPIDDCPHEAAGDRPDYARPGCPLHLVEALRPTPFENAIRGGGPMQRTTAP